VDWLSVLIGGAITLVVSGVFYGLAARDLKNEARALRKRTIELEEAVERTRHHIVSLGESLEEAGTTRLKKNEDGEWLRTVGSSLQVLYNVEANEPSEEEINRG
jgi:hypothetical protein